MKTIITFLKAIFYNLYLLAESKFTLGVVDPKLLLYFDNANAVPAPYGVKKPFNNEPADVWMGYDLATGQLCITNSNRTAIINCFTSGDFGNPPMAVEVIYNNPD